MLKSLFTWDRIKSAIYAIGSFIIALGLADESMVNELIGGLIMLVGAILDFFGVNTGDGTQTPPDANP